MALYNIQDYIENPFDQKGLDDLKIDKMKIQEIKFRNLTNKYSLFIGKNILNLLNKKVKLLCPRTKNIAIIIDFK